MPRRSWRDLTQSSAPAETAPEAPQDDGNLLHRLVVDAPSSQLAALLAERQRLETYLAGITGETTAENDHRSYPVTPLTERRAEVAAWGRSRDARRSRRTGAASTTRTSATPEEPGASRMLGLSGDVKNASPNMRSQLFAAARSGLRRFDDVANPAREFGAKVTGLADTLNDLDRKLAREGVSKSERDAIRRDLGGSTVDRVAGPIRRADEALARPRQLANGLESTWQRREQELAGPLDRFGGYATSRDRILDIDSGGSGDVFARADAARQRALARRSTLDREERRTEQRHERQHQRRLSEKQESIRLDRRTRRDEGTG